MIYTGFDYRKFSVKKLVELFEVTQLIILSFSIWPFRHHTSRCRSDLQLRNTLSENTKYCICVMSR